MPTGLTVNGTTYQYPVVGDQLWGTAATNWAIAVTSGMLQKAGGNFTLTADVNFGPTFGLLSQYFTTRTTAPAGTGTFRLAKTDTLAFRNNANSADLALAINGSDKLTFAGTVLATLAAGNVTPFAGGTGIDTSASTGVPTIAAGTWSVLARLTAALGGTAIDTSGSTGVPTISAGTWSVAAQLTALRGGTAIDTSASTGVPTISAGTWSVAAQLAALRGGTGIDTSGSTGVPKIASGTWSVASQLAETLGGTNQTTYATGDTLYASASNTLSKLTGNITTTKKFLTQTGGGAASAAPAWGTIAYADVTQLAHSSVVGDTPNGHGSTNTKVRRWTNTTTTGSDITYADSATNGMTLTINTTGYYVMTYTDTNTAASCNFGWSVNSAQLTTSINSITVANRLIESGTTTALQGNCSAGVFLSSGDVIRTHTDGTPNLATATGQFRIVRMA